MTFPFQSREEKMKNKTIGIIIMILALTICSNPTIVNAMEFDSMRASEYLDRYYAYIYSEGNGDLSIWFEVQGAGTMDEIGALSIRLQEKSDDSSTWTTIRTYSYTNYPNMLGYDDNLYISSVNYSGKAGYSYKAEITVWAGKDGDGDSRVIVTDTVDL